MKTSDSITNIAPALLEAQKAITFAVKDAVNGHFKSNYADLASVIDAVKKPLNDAGIVFIQSQSPCDSGFLALTTRLLHSSGEWIEDTASCVLSKNDAQGFGSASSYLRRYSLAAITGVYQDDDDGNAASGKDKPIPAQKQPIKAKDNDPIPVNEKEMTITLDMLSTAATQEELQAVFSAIWKRATKDQKDLLKPAYDARKAQLQPVSFGEKA